MENLVSLLDVERKLRHAQTEEEVLILSVNLLRTLFPYQSAVAFSFEGSFKPRAYSDTPYFNKKTPLVKSIARRLSKIQTTTTDGAVFRAAGDFGPELAGQGLAYAMVLPLIKPSDKRLYGAIVFFSDAEFSKESKVLAEHCGEVTAHAMASHRRDWGIRWNPKLKTVVVAGSLAAVMSIQIPLNSQAKAQVVPYKPHVVTAPMNGIIKSVLVKSNDPVKTGDLLLSYDDIEIKGKQRIAAQVVNISASEIVKQQRAAFFDPGIRNRLEESKAERAVKSLEYQAISAQLNKLAVRARESGTIVLDDPTALIGKPVKAGEKLLTIVDPAEVEIELLLPAHETHAIRKGDAVSVFLDNAPFEPIGGTVDRLTYEPVLSSSNIVSYKAYVKISDTSVRPPLGMCGNAKVYGEKMSLFWYIFRRPVAFVRWYFG